MNKDTQCPLRPTDLERANIKSFGRHVYEIPVEWAYDVDENIGGDYAKAVMVLTYKRATIMACKCGAEQERCRNGSRR